MRLIALLLIPLVVVAAALAAEGDLGEPPPAERPLTIDVPFVPPPPGPPRAELPTAPQPFEPIRWRRSRSLGRPYAGGRLIGGVKLPAEGELFFTWDPVKKRTPNRWWRRYAADWVLRRTLGVLRELAALHPDAPRVGIGDISRTRGGDFGRRFGPLGHASHQNGRDVDVYYPRLDLLERAPLRPRQVDRALAQELVDLFVAAGARKVFVGPSLDLHGPRKIVIPLAHHDNHLHARF